MTTYQYDPLPGQAYIRLITLYPGQFADDIAVSFHISPFSDNGPPRYEALSYTWGTEKSSSPVYVSSDDLRTTTALRDCQSILPQLNLEIALRHLRYVDNPRIMWIDALCINQTDDNEKGSQVAMMGDIFRLAHRVVAWIGPEENDSDDAMKFLDYLGSQLEFKYNVFQSELIVSKDCIWPALSEPGSVLLIEPHIETAIRHLDNRRWFSRLWVVQEMSLANQEAIIKCGSYETKWSNFVRAWTYIYVGTRRGKVLPSGATNKQEQLTVNVSEKTRRVIPASAIKGQKQMIIKSSLSGFFVASDFSMLNLRTTLRDFHCSDPRDHLYAVLTLIGEDERKLIPPPDYTQPYAELYTQVMVARFKSMNNINVLVLCELQDSSPCPSWVFDWSSINTEDGHVPENFCNTMSQIRAQFGFPEPGVMRVMGKLKSKVGECHWVPTLNTSMPRLTHVMLRAVALALGVGRQVTVDDFARAVVGYSFSDRFEPPKDDYPSMEEARLVIALIICEHQFEDNDFIWPSPCTKLLMTMNIWGQPYIKTEDGSIAIAPRAAQAGDEVYFVPGCRCPLLMRPQDNGKFKLVGPCIMPGYMHDEAFLGPLPDNIRYVQKFDNDRNRYAYGYKDVISGEFSYVDPRYKSLFGVKDPDFFRNAISQCCGCCVVIEPGLLQQMGVVLTQVDLI
ncbi:HET-domain-containing protein [Annulohypoxylon stygium]|nr:HET-domain-containing protein [Annulohypoxylon stygium]